MGSKVELETDSLKDRVKVPSFMSRVAASRLGLTSSGMKSDACIALAGDVGIKGRPLVSLTVKSWMLIQVVSVDDRRSLITLKVFRSSRSNRISMMFRTDLTTVPLVSVRLTVLLGELRRVIPEKSSTSGSIVSEKVSERISS